MFTKGRLVADGSEINCFIVVNNNLKEAVIHTRRPRPEKASIQQNANNTYNFREEQEPQY